VEFAGWNMVSSIGGFIFGASQLLFLYNVIRTIRGGTPASAQVWEGADGLEWTLPSPPPHHSFTSAPVVP